MTGLGAALTLFFCLMVVTLSRPGAVLSVFGAICYITQGQDLVLGFHFTAIRLVLLAGLVRTTVRGELGQIRINSIDRWFTAFVVCTMGIASLRDPTMDQLTYQFGYGYNAFMSYFLFRALLPGREEVYAMLRGLPWVIAPLALFMIREAQTGNNPFGIFGGVNDISMVRDGHARASAAFRSPITAGAFGATCIMLFGTSLFAGGGRGRNFFGLITASVIVVCARSSGPLMGLATGIAALALWPFRAHTRLIRLGLMFSLVGLHLVMKAPVWFLLGRVSDVVGGGGYHRAALIDTFVNHFREWCLAGTSNTSSWMATGLAIDSQADITNQFISAGVNAGLVGLILLVVVLVRCFQAIGSAMSVVEEENDANTERFLWGLGATWIGTIAILFSVSYFDQMHVIFYFLFALVCGFAFDETARDEADAGDQAVRETATSHEWQEVLVH